MPLCFFFSLRSLCFFGCLYAAHTYDPVMPRRPAGAYPTIPRDGHACISYRTYAVFLAPPRVVSRTLPGAAAPRACAR